MSEKGVIELKGRGDSRDFDLRVLHQIYKFESRKVSGSHGGNKKFSQCIWTIEDIRELLEDGLVEAWEIIEPKLNDLLEFLSSPDNKQLLRFKKDGKFTT